jgi:hypothetical protein
VMRYDGLRSWRAHAPAGAEAVPKPKPPVAAGAAPNAGAAAAVPNMLGAVLPARPPKQRSVAKPGIMLCKCFLPSASKTLCV